MRKRCCGLMELRECGAGWLVSRPARRSVRRPCTLVSIFAAVCALAAVLGTGPAAAQNAGGTGGDGDGGPGSFSSGCDPGSECVHELGGAAGGGVGQVGTGANGASINDPGGVLFFGDGGGGGGGAGGLAGGSGGQTYIGQLSPGGPIYTAPGGRRGYDARRQWR